MADLQLYLEAEKRGLLPEDKQTLLSEARKRGIIPPLEQSPQAAPAPAPVEPKSGVFDMLSAPFEMGANFAKQPLTEQAKALAPTVEALGAGGGAILGSGAGPVGTAVGAGAGYAGAKELMRAVTRQATPETLPQATGRVGSNLVEGVTLEGIGRGIVAPVIGKAAKAAGWVWDALTGNLTQVRAGKIVREIAGADLNTIKSLADGAPPNLTAAQATQPAGNNVLAALGDRAAQNDVTNFFTRTAAEQEAVRKAALQGVTPNLATAEAVRSARSSPLYTAATDPGTVIDTSPLVAQVDTLLSKNPGNKELVTALTNVKTGLSASQNAEQVASVLDGLKAMLAAKENKFIVKNLLDVKDSITSALPRYRTAQHVFAINSPPVNQAKVLGEMQSVLDKPGGGERVTPFLNVLGRGEDALIKRSGGSPRFGGLDEVLNPNQMAVVDDIASQYTRDLELARAAAAGRGGLSRILGENKSNIELPPSIGLLTRTANKLLSVLEGRVNTKTTAVLEKGMRSGKNLSAVLDMLPAAERVAVLKALSSAPQNAGRAVTFGANALAPQSANQLAP